MGETEKNLQAALAKLSEISKKGLGMAKDSIAQSSHTVKVKLDVTTLQRERKRLMADLGEEVYAAIKAKKLRSKLFDDLVNNIIDLDAKVEKKAYELAHAVDEASDEAGKQEEKEKTQ